MSRIVQEYYRRSSGESDGKGFFNVIPLIKNAPISWDSAHELVPTMCKGWFELTKLEKSDRIEFIRDFWLSKLPYHNHILENISQFFESLEDIQLYIVQETEKSALTTHLVYCLTEDRGFFHGNPGASEKEIVEIQNYFNTIFPEDYLAFLQIHNGFCKATDTGILPTSLLKETAERFWSVAKEELIISSKGEVISPKTLIPFYESFGMPFFQCFWSEWYPDQEMGNVYYSGVTRTISDLDNELTSSENMAFPTFMDWFFFYLEKIV